MTDPKARELEIVHAVARIQAGVLALVCAILGGIGLFLMTVWLVLKGGPEVGPHLSLLGQYFYGYSVSWAGSIVGLCYGALVGAVVGWTIGTVYNLVLGWRLSARR
ncbi:MAG TPA: hypothetical protein VEB21_21435 [Terriglobales bacterium]|nr:hypothetical protein [Terriglobales bacterium]